MQKRCKFNTWVRKIPWRRAWQPTLVLLPGESYGEKSLVVHSSWGHNESDTTGVTQQTCSIITVYHSALKYYVPGKHSSRKNSSNICLWLSSIYGTQKAFTDSLQFYSMFQLLLPQYCYTILLQTNHCFILVTYNSQHLFLMCLLCHIGNAHQSKQSRGQAHHHQVWEILLCIHLDWDGSQLCQGTIQTFVGRIFFSFWRCCMAYGILVPPPSYWGPPQ